MTATMTNNPPAIDAENGRINSKILELCSKPAPANTNPTLIGVGLYTHVAQPREDSNSAPKPEFLPLGGLNKVQSIRPINQQRQPDKQVAAVYKQLQETLEAEENTWKRHNGPVGQRRDSSHDTSEPSMATLKKKYGDPVTSGAMSELAIRNVSTKRRHSEIAGGSSNTIESPQKRKMSLAQITELRRKSAGDIKKSTGDIRKSAGDIKKNAGDLDIFGNPKVMRRASESKNTYDKERDPRRKGK
jgi:hypothetical protein